jgi:hypothetical protein
MRKILLSALGLAAVHTALAQNSLPVVQNVTAVKTLTGYTITYDLSDEENESCEVFLRASLDGGRTYNLRPVVVTGDVGQVVNPGTGKTINWQLGLEQLTDTAGEIRFRVVADDGYRPTLQEMSARIDSARIMDNFMKVYGNNSPADSAHYEQSRNNIRDHYESLGLLTELDTFFTELPDTILPVREGINVYGTIQGLDRGDSTILMTGHYDTVESTPGADDNNMSVAVCMEAARVLKDYTFRYNLKFANWDLEEIGLLGAYYYAFSDKSLGTGAVINFDGISVYKEEPGSQMVPTGFDLLFPAAYAKAEADSFRGNFITLITDAKSTALGTRAVELAPEVSPALKYIDLSCPDPSCLIATDLRRSDHAPFWDRGVPSIFLTATTEFRSSCYHQPCDTVASLAFSHKVIRLAAALMADKGGVMHAGKGESQALNTGIGKTGNEVAVKLRQPYPNPVEQSCFFEISLPVASEVRIEITDLQGRKVDQVISRKMPAGDHTIAWVPDKGIADGNYIAHVFVGDGFRKACQLSVALDPERLHHH